MYLAGPLFLLLLIAGLALSGSTPGESSSGQKVIAHYGDNEGKAYAAVFLVGPAVAVLMVFIGRFRTALGRGIGAPGKILQNGAILYGAGLLIANIFELGVVVASHNKLTAAAETINVLNNDAWIPTAIGMAVLLFGAGLAVLRTRVLPRWLGWVAVVIGVLSLLGPGGFLGFFVGPIWLAVAAVMLYVRRDETVALPA
jgi:hypothetical protein